MTEREAIDQELARRLVLDELFDLTLYRSLRAGEGSPTAASYGTAITHAPRLRVAHTSIRSCLWKRRSAAMALGSPLENGAHAPPMFRV